ncbi:Uncharacterized protein BC141101_03035 [Bacillus toyonensis]|uniref:hypothetical protein n=1 Tax=Bacillus TaxID=1386 RepID=UPI0001A0CC66|nr:MULTISPECIES: hypothetical protein [Bacillus cereus group]EEL39234.1 hypothetical protein bcere0020_33470 [Bacillus cereus Rock3-29]KAB0447168.1 hypothetical protein CH334_17205 [Lysinibacillus sp. VIA-II-2016]EJV48773.1 hypothetical protein IEA_01955 [Bacillus toyonensis]EJV94712.1 hypothetical protein IGI_01872 [Bacillus toyonensis]EOP39961.1 hypothetical protein IKI_02806 [Bacillus toyonensis]
MYIAFIFVIDIVHMSLSVKSIFVVVMPFILLVMIQRVILRVMIVGIIPLIVCAVQLSMNEYTSNFNRDRWLNDEEKRVHMVDDFMQKYKLIGKSNEEITQLLGTPTETRNEEEGVITLYYLGTERGFIPIDSEQLIFQFDRDGRVLTYKVQRG